MKTKAFVLATTFKGQDMAKIIEKVNSIFPDYRDHVLIHGHMPLRETVRRGVNPDFAMELNMLYPERQLCLYDSRRGETNMEALAEVATALDAVVVVIGDIRDDVSHELNMMKDLRLRQYPI